MGDTSPRRRDRPRRKPVNPLEARWAKAISSPSLSNKRPPLALPEAAQFFFRHLPRHTRGGPGVAHDEAWERKTALRNTIHDAYLRALARLPFNGPDGASKTMPSLLPALLAGGHCFGPLPDGASNVIVNTVWLHAASPPGRFAAADTVVDVVSLDHIKLGSFLGLTRVLLLDDRGRDYHAAAVAARHPNCEAFAAFAQSGVATSPAVTQLLANSSGVLSTEDIERLSALLVPHSAPRLQACLVPESKQLNVEREERIRSWQSWRRKVANMAIDHWNRTIGGPELQLKVVCGVSIGDRDYQHINFMATPRDNPAARQLFFAEYKHPMGVVLCCPVQDSVSQSGHCSLCEGIEERIIHPPFGAYNFRSPVDATLDIIDFDIANLLDIKYARHLWGSRHMVSSSSYTVGTDSSTEEWVSEYDMIIIR
ncbi:uncharacterized protein [Lolium perenne]|uniref:uncharacterized protein n=1 Tax=Lolium perenne TaxID=4522 RepID=UPI003A9947D2